MLEASGKFLYKCSTVNKYFKDHIRDGYGNEMYPYIMDADGSSMADHVDGEMWEVPDRFMYILDRFEDGYIRKNIIITFDGLKCSAEAYFITDDFYQEIRGK
jgi:hypothetical protein